MQRGGGNSGGGGNGRGRGRGRGGFCSGRGGMNRGGMHRVQTANGIPIPPASPLDDPFVLPFPRLHQKVGAMTLDEQLLRATLSQFTVVATSNLDFNYLYDRLKELHPDLIDAVYNSKPHFWSYLRCYPEQFGVDQDPRYPWNIYYLTKSKVVAKADRSRYKREFDAGNIRSVPDVEKVMNGSRYDVRMEKRAITYLYAIFNQYTQHANTPARQLDMKKIAAVFRPHAGVPKDISAYVDEVDGFLLKRLYFFVIFGGQVDMTEPQYVNTVRKLTIFLKEHGDGGYMNLNSFYEAFRNPQYFTADDYRAIRLEELFSYDDFVMFLHLHRFLFQMFTRDNRIKLRHDIVPEISQEEVRAVPPYKNLVEIFFTDDPYTEQSTVDTGFAGAGASVTCDRESDDDEFEEETYDGLPYQLHSTQRRDNPPSVSTTVATRQNAPEPNPARAASTVDVLASLRLVAAATSGQQTTAPTVAPTNVVAVREDPIGLPIFQDSGAPPRFVLRRGARPPRASNRVRPPAPDRLTQLPSPPNIVWASETAGNNPYSTYDRELEGGE